jgi:hypothetical protein
MSFKFKGPIINAPNTNPSLSRKKKGESKIMKRAFPIPDSKNLFDKSFQIKKPL